MPAKGRTPFTALADISIGKPSPGPKAWTTDGKVVSKRRAVEDQTAKSIFNDFTTLERERLDGDVILHSKGFLAIDGGPSLASVAGQRDVTKLSNMFVKRGSWLPQACIQIHIYLPRTQNQIASGISPKDLVITLRGPNASIMCPKTTSWLITPALHFALYARARCHAEYAASLLMQSTGLAFCPAPMYTQSSPAQEMDALNHYTSCNHTWGTR